MTSLKFKVKLLMEALIQIYFKTTNNLFLQLYTLFKNLRSPKNLICRMFYSSLVVLILNKNKNKGLVLFCSQVHPLH